MDALIVLLTCWAVMAVGVLILLGWKGRPHSLDKAIEDPELLRLVIERLGEFDRNGDAETPEPASQPSPRLNEQGL